MFSLQIVDTDAFLEMPMTSQLLYFHLSMRADDEGFVGNPRRIIKMVGSNDDDFKVLIAKRFILAFESGVVVIKHWLIHNSIRTDRFIETSYKDERRLLEIKENKSYTEKRVDKTLLKDGCQDDNQKTTKHTPSIGLGKVSIDKNSKSSNDDLHKQINELFNLYTEKYKEWISDEKPIFNWGACEKLAKPHIKNLGLERMKHLLLFYLKYADDKDREFWKKNAYSLQVFLSSYTLNILNTKYGTKQYR